VAEDLAVEAGVGDLEVSVEVRLVAAEREAAGNSHTRLRKGVEWKPSLLNL
jgi:hypothetical protein